ncbi:hypothetical protein KKF84_01960 [Myxococcota bacterium]|nr:hypothetical protein [Myxococcota bacterium]
MYAVYIVLGVTGVLFIAISLAILTMKRKSQAIISKYFSTEEIVKSTVSGNFFGLTSRGTTQVRGNGPLVLTKSKLWFYLLMPREIIEIPCDDITLMEIRKSHMGKASPYPLLYVAFQTDRGDDSAAWLISNPPEWVAALNELSRHEE